MKMKIYFIRHAKTDYNYEHRYLGTTDIPLCEFGIKKLHERMDSYGDMVQDAQKIYTSGLKRCIQTADIVFGGRETTQMPDLNECAFGKFEGAPYNDIDPDSEYNLWLKNREETDNHFAESFTVFERRIDRGFSAVISDAEKNGFDTVAIVGHGGTYMSLIDMYSYPHVNYEDSVLRHGCMARLIYDTEKKTLTLDGFYPEKQ